MVSYLLYLNLNLGPCRPGSGLVDVSRSHAPLSLAFQLLAASQHVDLAIQSICAECPSMVIKITSWACGVCLMLEYVDHISLYGFHSASLQTSRIQTTCYIMKPTETCVWPKPTSVQRHSESCASWCFCTEMFLLNCNPIQQSCCHDTYMSCCKHTD